MTVLRWDDFYLLPKLLALGVPPGHAAQIVEQAQEVGVTITEYDRVESDKKRALQ